MVISKWRIGTAKLRAPGYLAIELEEQIETVETEE
jgi:hypothetical protein